MSASEPIDRDEITLCGNCGGELRNSRCVVCGTLHGYRYHPDYATHPGELIVEMREEAGLKQSHLAGAARISPKHLCQVEKGVKPLTARVAVEIEIALGKRCADTLMAMQGYYDVHAERAAQRARVVAISSLLVEP